MQRSKENMKTSEAPLVVLVALGLSLFFACVVCQRFQTQPHPIIGDSPSGSAQDGPAHNVSATALFVVVQDPNNASLFYYINDKAVRMYDSSTENVTTLAQDTTNWGMLSDLAVYNSDLLPQFKGNLFFTDYGARFIGVVNPKTLQFRVYAGKVGSQGYVDGSLAEARFISPIALCFDPSGRYLYVSDSEACTIRKIDMVAETVFTFMGKEGECSMVDGPLSEATTAYSQGITMDHAGNFLYLSMTQNHCIRVINIPDGWVSAYAGDCILDGISPSDVDGDRLAEARFSYPQFIKADAFDNLWFTSFSSGLVRYINTATGFVGSYNGSFRADSTISAYAANTGALLVPQVNVTQDENGNLYSTVLYQADCIDGIQYYEDRDNDGYGDIDKPVRTCIAGASSAAGKSTIAGDCDDANAAIHPGATEVCNFVDDNCNDLVDENVTTSVHLDRDFDGFADKSQLMIVCTQQLADLPSFLIMVDEGANNNNWDCDDSNPAIHPGAPEVCNHVDDNCNNQIDENVTHITVYLDQDNDGYANDTEFQEICPQDPLPPRYIKVHEEHDNNNWDCDDADAFQWYANAPEVWDCRDNNCNGLVDEDISKSLFYFDRDNDGHGNATLSFDTCNVTAVPSGYVASNDDCNDFDPTRWQDCSSSAADSASSFSSSSETGEEVLSGGPSRDALVSLVAAAVVALLAASSAALTAMKL
eukprot:GEZU01010632.1.p1 GENE.GEZU01010632.1~~GEZU01010632.1.p1  ORF type:complete len:704 (-),score=125.71 GEZU01010632.1:44-2155(-)